MILVLGIGGKLKILRQSLSGFLRWIRKWRPTGRKKIGLGGERKNIAASKKRVNKRSKSKVESERHFSLGHRSPWEVGRRLHTLPRFTTGLTLCISRTYPKTISNFGMWVDGWCLLKILNQNYGSARVPGPLFAVDNRWTNCRDEGCSREVAELA